MSVPIWEEVTHAKGDERTCRLKVPGGWLYRCVVMAFSGERTVAMEFVPDLAEFPEWGVK